MEISVSSILQAPQSVTTHPFSERMQLSGDEEKLVEPVAGDLRITRVSNRMIQLTGDFHTRIELHCDRCGRTFQTPVDFSLDEFLEVVDEPPTSEEVEEQVFSQGNLDATDLLRQGLLLSLPSRKLCGCEPATAQESREAPDPRWAALKSLSERPNGNP